ncbi:MoxR family ATPase [Crocosphaera sp. XPORK-15E]|uniref:AAA family ATPase n=1 Tax=Crocosphaera sp. XPORK-15E TaxID=3110247 RepID=UPI002B21881B|nr:MoxR family ATPase [Crocosphaera sp. XPORK-15E]MEA5537037.1 MoxR family ATPase [Crocosphaera sp. XPORK-15E]
MKYEFKDDPNLQPENPHEAAPKNPEPYIITPELKKAVNLAIYLRRPLLLEGEAGCGKTQLARAVAYQLGLPYYRWNIRSTTKAQDGLYKYDAIGRLHDVQILERLGNISKEMQQKSSENLGSDNVKKIKKRNPQNPGDYIEFGEIGKAFKVKECPAVVLIDEIDKAELDFPNDLLTVLDKPWEFEIPETGDVIPANHQPIVIITSNKEKGNLPAPFLRRCLYHYVKFPDEIQLERIVKIHDQYGEQTESRKRLDDTSLKKVIDLFREIREDGLFKNPGTSEFLDWIEALTNFQETGQKIPYPVKNLSLQNLPYKELLLKIRADWDKFEPEGT